MNTITTILAVDDNGFQLQLIERYMQLLKEPYQLETANGGNSAWEALSKSPNQYDLVLLDRNMPDMNGLEVLKRIRSHAILKNIPVILQTGEASEKDILEGMQAGAYFYLTKPFTKTHFLSVVESVLKDRMQQKTLQYELDTREKSVQFIKHAFLEFKTVEEAQLVALLVANTCPNPKDIVANLAELLINAVEHGNLNISYAEKSVLQQNGQWLAEINKRLSMPEYSDRIVKLEVINNPQGVEFIISDEGNGFDWNLYLDFSPDRMMDSHGRGIAMANKHCFTRLTYHGKGNVVSAYYANPLNDS